MKNNLSFFLVSLSFAACSQVSHIPLPSEASFISRDARFRRENFVIKFGRDLTKKDGEEKIGDGRMVEYNLRDIPQIELYLKKLPILFWDSEPIDAKRRKAWIGSDVKSEESIRRLIAKSPLLGDMGKQRDYHEGILYVSIKKGQEYLAQEFFNEVNFTFDDWTIRLPDSPKRMNKFYQCHIPVGEEKLWFGILQRQHFVLAVEYFSPITFTGEVEIHGPVRGSEVSKLLKVMNRNGLFFGEESTPDKALDSLGDSEGFTIVNVPAGKETTIVRQFKNIGLNASLFTVLDGEASVDFQFGAQTASGVAAVSTPTREGVIAALRDFAQKKWPTSTITSAGKMGWRIEDRHFGYQVLEQKGTSSRHDEGWEEFEIKLQAIPGEKGGTFELIATTKTWFNTKGSRSSVPTAGWIRVDDRLPSDQWPGMNALEDTYTASIVDELSAFVRKSFESEVRSGRSH